MASVIAPFEIFLDASGAPLSGGNLYIGTASLNPETNPITVYWDSAQTIPAAQPIKINGGYPSYAGSPGKLYVGTLYSITVKDKNGKLIFYSPISEAALGGAAVSTGAKNYVAAPDFESGTTAGWNLSKDSGTTVPISGGIGGGTTGFSALTIDNATPLAGTGSLVLNKNAGDVRGSTVYSNNITIDLEDTVRTLQLTFSYRTPTTNYTSGDLSVFIWDVNGSNLIPMSASSLDATVGGPANFFGTFIPSSNRVYRIIFQFTTTNANALLMNLDSVVLGPQVIPNAAAIGAETSWTPTFSAGFGTVINIDMKYRRIGDNLIADGLFQIGLVAGTIATFTLPSGLTAKVDLSPGSLQRVVGKFWTNSSVATQIKTGTLLVANGSNLVSFSIDDYTSAIAPVQSAGMNVSSFLGNNLYLNIQLTTPISQWTTNINLATDFTEYAYNTSSSTTATDTTSFANGMQGAPIQVITSNLSRRVRFQRPIQPTDKLSIEFSHSSDPSVWYPLESQVAGMGGTNIAMWSIQNTTQYGVQLVRVAGSKTDVDVWFSAYAFPSGATFGSAGSAWTGASSVNWRVRKVSNGNMSEIPPIVIADYTNDPGTAIAVSIKFSSKTQDTHNAFSTTTGIFTCPISGNYQVSCSISMSAINQNLLVVKNGTFYRFFGVASAITQLGWPSMVIKCVAGDTLQIQSTNAVTTAAANAWATFVRVGS
jgi:hypothetical protein